MIYYSAEERSDMMAEIIILSVFALALIFCVVLDFSVLVALVFGFFLFAGYALYKKHSVADVFAMSFSGIKTVKNILITFVLIGIITAVWRVSGTIPYIVYHSTKLCTPDTMLLATFLLCGLISTLTGTAFGTAATMGMICTTIANGMGIPPVLSGGAMLAGCFFGDRCSPMSTSALLISTLTKTDIYRNIKNMIRTAVVPFLITCCVYVFLGMRTESVGATDVHTVFAENFVLNIYLLIPAAIIIILSLFKVNVKITMSISIVAATILALLVQKTAPAELLKIFLFGYSPENEALAALLSGGGIFSMTNVILIVCISSCYAGIFKKTGLLDSLKGSLTALGKKSTPFGSVLITAVISSMVACNQTLAIMLTYQLCDEVERDEYRMANYLENTAVVISPLIPWSIACAVPLGSADAPMLSILAACYLYLLPIWNIIISYYHKKNKKKKNPQV